MTRAPKAATGLISHRRPALSAGRVIGRPRYVGREIVDRLAAAAFLCSVHWRRTHTLRTLLRLDDRRLAGIGLTRGELAFALSGPPTAETSRCDTIATSANESSMKPARA